MSLGQIVLMLINYLLLFAFGILWVTHRWRFTRVFFFLLLIRQCLLVGHLSNARHILSLEIRLASMVVRRQMNRPERVSYKALNSPSSLSIVHSESVNRIVNTVAAVATTRKRKSNNTELTPTANRNWQIKRKHSSAPPPPDLFFFPFFQLTASSCLSFVCVCWRRICKRLKMSDSTASCHHQHHRHGTLKKTHTMNPQAQAQGTQQ